MCAEGKAHTTTQTEFEGWDEENIVEVTKTVIIRRAPTEADFARFAKTKGWVVQPIERLRTEVRLSVATRLQNRVTSD